MLSSLLLRPSKSTKSRALRGIQKFARLASALAGRLVNQLRDLAIVVAKLPKVDRSPDPDDNHLLALAEAGKAQFLVTGDKQLLSLKRHKFARIISPATLVELLR
jgi:uncharacterized protein